MNKTSVLSYESDLRRLKELKEKNATIAQQTPKLEQTLLELPKSDIKPEHQHEDALKTKPIEWKKEDAELIEWFQGVKRLPKFPFQLKGSCWVEDCEKFYSSIRADIAAGPKGTRALFGALQDDLKNIKRITEENERN